MFLQYFLNMWFNVSSIFPAISCCLQNLDLCKITGFLNFSSKEPPSPSPTIRLSPINPQHCDTPRIYLKRMYIELKHCIVVEISTENKSDTFLFLNTMKNVEFISPSNSIKCSTPTGNTYKWTLLAWDWKLNKIQNILRLTDQSSQNGRMM